MSKRFPAAAGVLACLLAVGCSAQADVEKVPVGAKVDVTRQDGGMVEGKLTDKTASTVAIEQGHKTTLVDRKDIADIRVVDPRTPEPPPKAKFREITVQGGTRLAVKLDTTVASNASHAEEPVSGTLVNPVSEDDVLVLPAGSTVKGVVTSAVPSGKVKGRASLAIRFTSIVVDGQSYTIAASYSQAAQATKGDDAKKIGIGAAGGAVVGAILGGGKGAAIGTAVGGGAGTAVVLSTSGDEVQWPAGSVIDVALAEPVDVKVPIKKVAAGS
jgi:hypothetical protein